MLKYANYKNKVEVAVLISVYFRTRVITGIKGDVMKIKGSVDQEDIQF